MVPNEQFWDVACDILIPAALEGQITAERAQKTTAKLVLEGANGPTMPEADDILAERGVLVVPDVICNAGGVTVSYFEWVQDFSSFFWNEDEINVRLDRIMIERAEPHLGHRRQAQDHAAHRHLRGGLRAHSDGTPGTRPVPVSRA